MADEKRITTVAYRLHPELENLPLDFQLLRFPEIWKPQLLELQREVSQRRNGKVSIPIWTLNAALRALVPDLIAISPWAAYAGERDWLISKEYIDINALRLVANAWARSSFAAASQASLREMLMSVSADDLKWTACRIDLAAANTLANGTSDPHQHTYNVCRITWHGASRRHLSQFFAAGNRCVLGAWHWSLAVRAQSWFRGRQSVVGTGHVMAISH